jgi:hypothetical protein
VSEEDETEKCYYDLNLSIAHAHITKVHFPPLSEDEKDKVLHSLFVSREDYERYVVSLRQQEEQESKNAEAREAKRKAEQENDPRYWKRLYLNLFEREEERKREREMILGVVMLSGIVGAIMFVAKFVFHWL